MAFYRGPILTGAATDLGTVQVDGFTKMTVDLDLSASTETVNVTASEDGSNFNAAKLRPIDMSTGAVFASGDMKDGLFSIDVTGLYAVKFTKSNASETATIRIGFFK